MSTTYEILYAGRTEAVITSTSDEPRLAELLLAALRQQPTDYGTTGQFWAIREKKDN